MLEFHNPGAPDKEVLPFLYALCNKFLDQCTNIFRVERNARWALSPAELLSHMSKKRQIVECHQIDPIPEPFKTVQVIIGDVDPAIDEQFFSAFEIDQATGVQVDFDDAACPSWHNICKGQRNIAQYCQTLDDKSTKPIMLFRPRSWNLLEPNVTWNGNPIYGALYDFAVHAALNSNKLYKINRVIALFLPKLESSAEAALWDEIFTFTETFHGLPRGAFKASVIVESFPLMYDLDEVLNALKHHSLGLNCGILDYVASIAFRCGMSFDTVSVDTPFIVAYRRTVVEAALRHGAPCTGGMIAVVPEANELFYNDKFVQDTQSCLVKEGFMGCLTYSPSFCQPLKKLFAKGGELRSMVATIMPPPSIEQLIDTSTTPITDNDNTQVLLIATLLAAWKQGYGHFLINGSVQDSATIEICRSRLLNNKSLTTEYDLDKHRPYAVDGTPIEVCAGDIDQVIEMLKKKYYFVTDWLYQMITTV